MAVTNRRVIVSLAAGHKISGPSHTRTQMVASPKRGVVSGVVKLGHAAGLMASGAIRLALVLCVGWHTAWAQTGYMVQGGSVARGHAPVAIQSGAPGAAIYGDGGPALAGAFSEIGISASGTPFCINDQVPSSPGLPPNGPYHQLCLGANSLGGGLISYNAYNGATPLTLTCIINGSVSPCFGSGVVGESPTQVGQIASYKNMAGTLIGEGAAGITDSQTGAIAATGATLAGLTSASLSADTIESYVFCTGAGQNLITQCGGGNYDGVRGVGISNPGTTVPIVSGVSAYVIANQAFSGSGPSSVALFGTGAVIADNAEIWGVNVNMSDRQYRVADSGTHNRRVTGIEADVSASYPDTNLTGIFVAGNSVVQPTNSTGFAVLGQDFSAPTPGSIAKWTQAYYSYPGVATHFANIGQLTSSTVATDSQDFIWGAYVNSVAYQGLFYFGLARPTNFGSTAIPSFNFNYPIQTMTGGLTARSSANEVIQLGGALDLGTGTSIESRSDAGSPIQPLEILSSNIFLNSNIIQVNNGSGITTAVTCPAGSPSSSFATINGIVTHC